MKQSCCTDDKDPAELGMETDVFIQLKFSYDNLRNDTLRDCFLTCALWPEDEKIPKDDLAQCWMGLGLVDDRDIQSSFRKSYSLIADLTAACLLEDGGDLYSSVKVHDVIRDMALWISCECGENSYKWFVPAPVGNDKKVIINWNSVEKTVECISLAKTSGVLWFMSESVDQRFPIGFNPIKLRILCLQNNKLDETVIVEAVKNCTSLTYLDLRGNKLKRTPEELCSLGKLEYLALSENELEQVPRCFGNLTSLKFLYIKSNGEVMIPIEVISSLKALQVIDLRTSVVYGKDRVRLNPGVFRELGTLPQLKALGIQARGFAEFKSLREVANLLLRYLRLTGSEKGALCLSDILSNDFAQRTLYDLNIKWLKLEHIIVRQDPLQPNNHFGVLNKLCLDSMPDLKEVTWMGTTPAFIFPRLTCLELKNCYSLLHLSWVMYLPRLEQLHIISCEGRMVQAYMRYHGDKLCNGQENTKTFPCLKVLHLSCNLSLQNIGDNGMEFPCLERLVLYGCPKLKRLPFQLDTLPLKLKELRFDYVQCWENLECEEGVKTFLQPAIKFELDWNDLYDNISSLFSQA